MTNPRKLLPDKIVLAMSKFVGSSIRRGFVSWRTVIADRKALWLKALKLTRRACYHMKYGAAFKAMASLKLNAKLKQAARAQRETRRHDQEASAKVGRVPAASHDFNRKDPRPSGQRRTNCASPASRSTSAAAQFRQGPGNFRHWARDGAVASTTLTLAW